MNRRHCDVCDCIIFSTRTAPTTTMVKSAVVAVRADIERWTDEAKWRPTVDYCRTCLGELMFEYSQWLLRKL